MAARPATKILACRRASWSQSAACGSGWASIAPVMMMSIGVASGRIVPSRRPRARTCSSSFLISVRSATIFLVIDDGAAVEGEDQLVACRDRLFEELLECRGGRVVAMRGGARVLQDELEGAQSQRRQEGRARRVVAVEGSDPDARLVGDRRHWHSVAVAPDRDRGGGEDALAIGCGVTAQPPRDAPCLCRCFGHPGDDRATSRH